MSFEMDYFYQIACFYFLISAARTNEIENPQVDPCCSFPCQQNGVCLSSRADVYECDCTGTGYYGKYCEIPYFTTTAKSWVRPSKDSLHYFVSNFPLFWKAVNRIDWFRRFLMKIILKVRIGMVDDPVLYNGFGEYPTWDSYSNITMYARSLPAVPLNCPTAMGVKGKKILPDVEVLLKMFERDAFQPCPRRTSIIFPYFAQHFTHQFFKTDGKKHLPYQWGDHSVDLSHVYGNTLERQNKLRMRKDGKLKFSIKNGEVFPPTVDDADVPMIAINQVDKEYRFAVGHSGFTVLPPLLFFATIWLREHNRVCDILKEEHPAWNDERIYQTARLILIGETIKIVIEDYVQHISGYNYKLLFDPELLHGTTLSYHNKIHVEFQLLYRWHALMPDHLEINNTRLSIHETLFNPKPFIDAGMKNWVEDATRQFASKVPGGRTQGHATINVARQAIIDGRKLRLQSMNAYRKKFGMKPYEMFTDFIEDPAMAKELEELYGDVDAVEFFVGIMLEKRKAPLMFGQTLTEMGSPYSLKGLFGNPIGSPSWWKPSTFGGEKGFDIIKTTNLQDLICRNVAGCPHASFAVPDDVTFHSIKANNAQEDNTAKILMDLVKHIIRSNETSQTPSKAEKARDFPVNSNSKLEL